MAEFRPPNEYQDIAQPDFDFWNDLHLPSYEDQDDQRLSLPYAEPTGDEQIIFGFTSVTASSHHDDPWTSTSGDNVSSTVNDDRPRPSIGALGTSSIAEDDRMELSSSQYHHGDASLLTCEYTPLSFSMPLPHTTNFANPNESQKLLIAHPTSAHERMDFLDADFRPSDDRSPCQASTTFVKSSPDKRSLTTGHDKESNQKPISRRRRKQHSCPICDESFYFPKDLRRHHRAKHGTERPYKCPEHGCKYRSIGFKRKDARKRHVRSCRSG